MRFIPASLLSLLVLAGCDGFTQSDEPLPSFEYLLAEYEEQPAGRGTVREEGDRDRTFEAYATHLTTGEGELVNLHITLRALDGVGGVPMYFYGVSGDELEAGMEFEHIGFFEDGRLLITSVEGDRIAGVFAGDIQAGHGALYPNWRRAEGRFNAVPDTTGQ